MTVHLSVHSTWRAVLVAALAASALAAPTAGAEEPRTTRATYVGAEFGSDLLRPRDTPVGTVAPLGAVRVVATGERVTVVVDDAGALTGTTLQAHLRIGRTTRFLCLPDSIATAFPVPAAGATVDVVLFGPTARLYPWAKGCQSAATAGVLTLVH